MKIWSCLFILYSSIATGQSYDAAVVKADGMIRRYANQIFNRAGVVGIYHSGKDTIIAKGRINSLGRKADKDDVFSNWVGEQNDYRFNVRSRP